MVRPWASTPHVDDRNTTATGCCGTGAGASGGTVITIALASTQLGGDVERHVGDDAAVDQRVAVELDRREHPGERRTGDDGRHDIAGVEDERPSGREVGGDDRQRDRGVLDEAGAEVLAEEGDAVAVVEERCTLCRRAPVQFVPGACATGRVV